MASSKQEEQDPPLPVTSNTTSSTSDAQQNNGNIRYVPFESKHVMGNVFLTLAEFPFPENILASLGFLMYATLFGVVALDENDKIAGYFLGGSTDRIGLSCKRVKTLIIVCVSSKHQKKGVATNLGKYMMDGKHPKFSPEDYDEVILQDTDTWNSPSWLFSDRNGLRYFPTHEMIRRFGLLGYFQIILYLNHTLPCQFMKRRVKNEEEAEQADQFETQKGIIACIISGILPSIFWICSWIMGCKDKGIKSSFAGWVFLSVYFLLGARFCLAHLLATERVVFREYDNWWSPLSFFWPPAVFGGFPLLGWTGGFYIGVPGINYLHDKYKKALARMYLPINMFTFVLFFLHQLARIIAPQILLWADGILDILGYAAFFCSVTDIASPIEAFPSGAMAIRRWDFVLFAGMWLCWCAVLACGIILPEEGLAPDFLDLSHAACKAL